MPRILILDDDEDLLSSQSLYLESKGYQVDTAQTMEEALTTIRERKPDLVLADLMMEHYDTGFVFCKRAREQEGMKSVPILMQTAAARELGFTFDASTPKQKEWMKVDEVLIKPVPLEDLTGKIEQHLKKRR